MGLENLSNIELAYKLGSLISTKENFKLQDIDATLKIYHFYKTNLSIIVFVYKLSKKVLYIKSETDIIEIVNFVDDMFSILNIDNVSLTKVNIEDLVVDKCENIYVTVLTEDNISIDLDEDFFKVIPKDGDILDSNLSIKEKDTENKKLTIAEKFNKLKK